MPAGNQTSPPGVTLSSSVSCRPHIPWYDGWMKTPSPPYCRLDLVPSLADRFVRGMAPFDYGPILLRKPFRLHLTVDALSSGCRSRQNANLGVFLCLFPSFPTSCPFKASLFAFPGQRDITPAFGYDAPHLSARGTLTLLSYALPSTHCELVRPPYRHTSALPLQLVTSSYVKFRSGPAANL